MYLSPSHGSGQGTHSSRSADRHKLLLGEEGKRKGSQGVSWPKPEPNGVTKISFDRRDMMSLSTALQHVDVPRDPTRATAVTPAATVTAPDP